MATAALVVGNSAGLTSGDTWLQTRLTEAIGAAPTVVDDGAAENTVTFPAVTLIVIAPSVAAATMLAKWKDFAGAVVVARMDLWLEHELSTDDGAASSVSTFWVPNPAPSWLTLVPGQYKVAASGAAISCNFNQRGDVVDPAQVEAFLQNSASSPTQLFGWTIESGFMRDDSTPAPGRRAAMYFTEVAINNASYDVMTLARDLFKWAAGLTKNGTTDWTTSDPKVWGGMPPNYGLGCSSNTWNIPPQDPNDVIPSLQKSLIDV